DAFFLERFQKSRSEMQAGRRRGDGALLSRVNGLVACDVVRVGRALLLQNVRRQRREPVALEITHDVRRAEAEQVLAVRIQPFDNRGHAAREIERVTLLEAGGQRGPPTRLEFLDE